MVNTEPSQADNLMIRNKSQVFRTTLILLLSIVLVVVVTWFTPSLSATSRNMLFRLRGEFAAPADIVIVAIDDRSLQRIGQWPWPRSVMAAALDKLAQANPGGIGLDVIYAEPTTPEEDRRLATAIARNGRVILPAQLYESAASTDWLRPLPEFAQAARGLGHAHVSPDVDGMVRSIQLSKADDQGNKLWAFGLEVIRAAEGISADEAKEESGWLNFGPYRIPVRDDATKTIPGVTIIRPNEMLINFAGPTGSFQSFSIADLIEGKLPPATFAGKIVLIGAVADSMGDTRVAPFMHYSADGIQPQGGQEMPGVEIHANIINTIRRRLSFRPLPEWMAFAAALAVILLSAMTIRWVDGWRQITILALILLSILTGSFLAFSHYLVIPPLPALLTGFAAVIPLLLNRSLAASRELDLKLAALVSSQKGFLPDETRSGAEFVQNQLRLDLPQSLTWKLRAVDDLTTRLLARMSFINRILSNMAEGVLVADLEGRIVFANREATQLFDCELGNLAGANLADFLIERGVIDPVKLREAVASAATGQSVQLDYENSSTEPRYYSLLLSALPANLDTPGLTESEDALDSLSSGAAIGVVVLISDITKRVELDRMKTETLQLVSHELRTPLTSIQGLSDVLLKFSVPEGDSREMLSTIHSEAVRLGETINRYLDLTRLESSAQALHLSPVDCGQLIAGCIRNLSVFAAERRIRLTAKIEPDLPAFPADAQLLTQAVSNLLSNAIKYSPPETEVVIAAARQQANLTISVRDQGFGIPEEARERIFEKFYRLQRDTTSNIVGTGLGLPLVREIVEQHGGRITVESIPDKGSTFTIHLPIGNATASA
ncbi:MAG TPA: CHASE2 domain-containing protein [Blastocatellia bacterium]